MLVFLSGCGFDCRIWNSIASHYRKIRLINIPAEKNLSLDDIFAYFAECIPSGSIVMGWSLGGLIAIKLNSLFPEKFYRLILVASTPRFLADEHWPGLDEFVVKQFIRQVQVKDKKFLTEYVKQVNYPNCNNNFHRNLTDNIAYEYFLGVENLETLLYLDLRDEYKKLNSTTMHVLAAKDVLIKPKKADLMSLNVKVNVCSIANAGHACFVTHERIFMNLVNNFIQ